ncbi:MAG: ferritin family protein [Bacteroides sp.]
MKKIYSYLIMAIAVAGMVACTPSHDKTIANLKAAIDGETTASTKYAAFAEQATKDSLYNIAALFKATSQAEAIHIKNHQAALATLGVTDYMGGVQAFDVKSTAENLKAAIDGETYEFTTMYPNFIKEAQTEKVQEALVSFNFAQDAEKGHAKLYADALAKIATPDALAKIYYVCPKCGNTYAGTPSKVCELCQTPYSAFIISEAVIPL